MAQPVSEYFTQLAETHRKRAARVSDPERARNHAALAQGYETLAQDALNGVSRRARPASFRAESA